MEEVGDCWDYLVWVSLRVSFAGSVSHSLYSIMPPFLCVHLTTKTQTTLM